MWEVNLEESEGETDGKEIFEWRVSARRVAQACLPFEITVVSPSWVFLTHCRAPVCAFVSHKWW